MIGRYLLFYCIFFGGFISLLGVDVTSENVEISERENEVFMRFSDGAKICGKEFYLNGDVIEILSDRDNSPEHPNLSAISSIEAIDNASFSERNYHGKGSKITLLPSKSLLIIEGDAEIVDTEKGAMHGDKLVFDRKTKKIRAEGRQMNRPKISIDIDSDHNVQPADIAQKIGQDDKETEIVEKSVNNDN